MVETLMMVVVVVVVVGGGCESWNPKDRPLAGLSEVIDSKIPPVRVFEYPAWSKLDPI